MDNHYPLFAQQAYFVYPLIEESDRLQLKDAESMYQTLKQEVFPEFKLELIHSRLPEDEKERIMGAFVAGKVDILVATTVMEVGMDVPNAGCIVIEHAERFGLSNLHQLRGRVGRGQAQSYAFLIYSRNLTEEGLKRLKVIMTTSDGFKIAEEDLKLRGPGEFLGVRQSGFLSLGPADPIRDQEVFASARKDAAELMRSDPDLLKPENRVFLEILSGDLFGEGEGA
ncbi:ATP-dependent DNA helicase RecG [subsurface metagenome]